MQKLLALPRPQAVFIGNDAMAVGAYQAFIRPGCVPRIWRWLATMILNWPLYDAAVDHHSSAKDELGELAIDVLIHRMADPRKNSSACS
jgi:LacI family transcriptional regulator